MLLDAKLDKELWAEAAVIANYIKNRSPSSSVESIELRHFRSSHLEPRGHMSVWLSHA